MARRLRNKDTGWKDVVGMPDECQIELTKGKIAIIDREDLELVSAKRWHYHNGYARAGSKDGKVYMHRLINRTPEGLLTDHINGDRLDNRKVNLRNATKAQNASNAKKVTGSSSRYKGVNLMCNGKWRAKITVNYKSIHLGVFKYEKDAYESYVKAARKYQGIYARI